MRKGVISDLMDFIFLLFFFYFSPFLLGYLLTFEDLFP
jgi:hypothetical protein